MNRWLAGRPQFAPCLVAVCLLVYATGRHPYGVYVLTRWTTFSVALVTIWLAIGSRTAWAIALLVPLAALFNPLAPLHLGRELWHTLDFIAAAIMVVSAMIPHPKRFEAS